MQENLKAAQPDFWQAGRCREELHFCVSPQLKVPYCLPCPFYSRNITAVLE